MFMQRNFLILFCGTNVIFYFFLLWLFSFIKWVDCCCCGGAANGHATAKEESGEDAQQHIFPICKDIYFPHLAKTKACEALAKYPASMPLYSGYFSFFRCSGMISYAD